VRKKYEAALSSLKDQNRNGVPDGVENVLADNNRNGVPDIIENTPGAPIFKTAMKILVDGQEFHNLDDLPPEARAKYEQAMSKLDANHNGVPDFMEGMMSAGTLQTQQTTTPPAATNFGIPTSQPISSTSISSNSAITPDTSNGWLLGLLVLGLLFLCALGAAGVWYFLLR
jgi:hypothetical protein